MNKLKATLDIFANNKVLRLGALTLIAASLAIPAFGFANACTPGQPVIVNMTCPGGANPMGECSCTGWSQSGGYTGCTVLGYCV